MIHSMNGGAAVAFAKDGVAQFQHHFGNGLYFSMKSFILDYERKAYFNFRRIKVLFSDSE